jgi:glycine dehydrogenase subunit 2
MARSLREPEKLLFEISRKGHEGYRPPANDVGDPSLGIEDAYLREDIPGFPEVTEVEVVRHFTRLSHWNYALDDGLYPLGSCTMKHNPRINERMARLPGFADSHPLQPCTTTQGSLRLMHELEGYLAEITGMDRVTLQPAAGAQGELTGVLLIRAYLTSRGDARRVILIPDSAHGTNPASAALCGYGIEEIRSGPDGCVDVEHLRERMGKDVAAVMLTNPNTLGIFESRIREVCSIVHEGGGLVYMDGANMNAMLGLTRPGDAGVDVLHLNLHKTFTTPHGGGGPGSGPVALKKILAPFLPVPVIEKEGDTFRLRHDLPHSIGKIRSFQGNFGMLVRAYTYIRTMGPDGLKEAAEVAILNANYLRGHLDDVLDLPYDAPSLHEVVLSDRSLEEATGVKALDLAKRLLDYGFHPPTVYFPLIVKGAVMIEPTETESREELDTFIRAIRSIVAEAKSNPEIVKTAPHTTPVRRLDEASAARKPRLRWKPA